jgi:hypothetical protein
MRQRGRASIVIVAGIVSVLLVAVLFFLSKESPSASGAQFMDALASGNINKLAEFSYMENSTKEQMRQKWQRTFDLAAKHYSFAWRIVGDRTMDDEHATVTMMFVKDAAINPDAYEEKYELPMVKIGNDWKVDVRRIPREMFPRLPR